MSSPTTRDQSAVAEGRLITQWDNSPNVKALLKTWEDSLNHVENTLFDLLDDRSITTAIGEQLDVLGRIVGEERKGKDDNFYRAAILGRIVANTSDGSSEEILSALRTVCGTNKINVFEHYPADVHMLVDSGANNLTALALDNACSAAVNTRVIQDLDSTMFLATEYTTIEDIILETNTLDILNVIDASSNLYELKMGDVFGSTASSRRGVFPEYNSISGNLLNDPDMLSLSGWTTLTGAPSVDSGTLTLSSASITQSITTISSQEHSILASPLDCSSSFVIKVGTTSGGSEIATLSGFSSINDSSLIKSFTAVGTTTYITIEDASSTSTLRDVYVGTIISDQALSNPLCDVTGYEQYAFEIGLIGDGTDNLINDEGYEIKYITEQ